MVDADIYSFEKGDSFKEKVLESQVPVIVDFYADWCGPCKKLGPALEEKIKNNAGKVKLVKVNVDDHDELAEEYEVGGIPHVILFVDGVITNQFTGFSMDGLDKMIGSIK